MKADHEWVSDEQEVATLVEDFIVQNAIPADIKNRVTRLHNSEESLKALEVILESLD